MGIATVNPATGETIKIFEPLTAEEIEAKLALAENTFKQYRKISLEQKSQWLKAAADILERDQRKLGEIMTFLKMLLRKPMPVVASSVINL